MATARDWKTARHADGPHPVRLADVPALNQVFSDAFTERYRRDGMVGVRVPFLNPAIWRYAIEDAGSGAMAWRGERDEIVAFNIAHRSGIEGWMGPLAVRPEWQGGGLGKDVVRAGVRWLSEHATRVIGLETMPRTMDNIGFYSGLGFLPSRLTITLTLDAASGDSPAQLYGRLSPRDKDDALAECLAMTQSMVAEYDYSREITLTDTLSLGDTLLIRESGRLIAFALCHTAPLVEGRTREELRVLKMAVSDPARFEACCHALMDYARRSGTRRVAFRVQGEYVDAYARLVAMGARVRWTDLRMTMAGYPEPRAERGIVLSNWEI
ncbi:MAG TPA: GNAT family N-acetyltransferase [Gemmatimonadaceae bacterium]|nr:GNAT family N-acetyltransferase [Gemmatimonadaceae bacterium]